MYLNLFIIITIFISHIFNSSSSAFSYSQEKKDKEFVYLLHGLGRSKTAMWLLASRLEDAGFIVQPIDYSSLSKSPQEILNDVSEQINNALPPNGQPVHFVGHSLGGLLIRAYLDANRIDNLGNVVLLGTPNKGTPLVDHFRDSWWFHLLGPTTLSLGTDKNSFPNSIAEPYYPVGVIAGISESFDNEEFLPGKDDGLVPLESTKLNGMSDMVIVKSGHSMMRYNAEVAEQTIAFLCYGKFKRR
ncbi:MAG: alpha/beta fold hydrolase [Deferribacteres bacterium]|nr:alpha/beta fold hydrolase [candidate division KSB1 bacterium]MCB9504265.1 alpha/beta fold hydrolase [Deferribacteres bacterium]